MDRIPVMLIAITRQVSPAIQQCELTHLQRQPIDAVLAQRQHRAYEAALAELGCDVRSLPAEPDLPDSVFVEDIAIVLDEVAVITRPGAESRRPETASVAAALAAHRPLRHIEAPGTLDGGDVLRVGRALYVGLSSRSNAAAVEQLQTILAPFGYAVTGIQVAGCLHLKSAVTQIAEDALLVNPEWVDASLFGRLRAVEIDPAEPYAANAVWIGDAVVYPTSFPSTRRQIEARGIRVAGVDVSELQKAEGAVTCCSLIFRGQ
jgi:dimethylargininase